MTCVLKTVWPHNQCAVPEKLTSCGFQMILWYVILLSRSVCWRDNYGAGANQMVWRESSRIAAGLLLLDRCLIHHANMFLCNSESVCVCMRLTE